MSIFEFDYKIYQKIKYFKNTLEEAFPEELINADDYCCAEWFEGFGD